MTPRKLTAEEFYEEELTKLRALWDAKNPIALFDAVRYCQAVDLPLPEWAALAVLNTIRDHFEVAKGHSGGSGGVKERLAMDYAHHARWNALKTVLTIHGLKELPKGRGRPTPGKLTAEPLLTAAKGLLKGKAKHGGTKQIKQSFDIVEKSLAAGEARFNLHHLFTRP
jgi:hypothetical protein